jgi:hypothetical protein
MPFYLIFGTQHIMLIEREIKEDNGREWRTWRRAEFEKEQRKEEIRGMYRKYIEEGPKRRRKAWRMTANKIEVSIKDFARMNQGLIHLLQAIDSSPGGSIPTVKLLAKLKSTGYGQHIIRRAVREGYMARKEQPPEGKGNYLVINYLTPKGKALLRKLSDVNDDNNKNN